MILRDLEFPTILPYPLNIGTSSLIKKYRLEEMIIHGYTTL